jgi:AraC-like DNA-binding protein
VVQPPIETARLVQSRMLGMLKIWSEKPVGFETILGGTMAELLGHYLQNATSRLNPKDYHNPVWDRLEKAMAYMRANYGRNIGVDDISRAAGLSTAYFSREFRKSVGIAPYAYLNHVRVEIAKRILLTGKENCSEVAILCGFSSLHVFSKAFKRITRRSPTEWLKRA